MRGLWSTFTVVVIALFLRPAGIVLAEEASSETSVERKPQAREDRSTFPRLNAMLGIGFFPLAGVSFAVESQPTPYDAIVARYSHGAESYDFVAARVEEVLVGYRRSFAPPPVQVLLQGGAAYRRLDARANLLPTEGTDLVPARWRGNAFGAIGHGGIFLSRANAAAGVKLGVFLPLVVQESAPSDDPSVAADDLRSAKRHGRAALHDHYDVEFFAGLSF